MSVLVERAAAALEQGDVRAYDELLERELRPSLDRLRAELTEAEGALGVLNRFRAGRGNRADTDEGPANGNVPDGVARVLQRRLGARESRWFRKLSARQAALVVMREAPDGHWASDEVFAVVHRRGHPTEKVNVVNSLGRAAQPTAKPAPLVVRTNGRYHLTAAGRDFARRLVGVWDHGGAA